MNVDRLTTILVIYLGMGIVSYGKLTGDYSYGRKEALRELILWPLIVVAMPLLLIILLVGAAGSRLVLAPRLQ